MTRPLGGTGTDVTILGFGAMELRGRPRGPEVADEDASRLLNEVLDSGINLIDTSPDYGRSEELIGTFIGNRRDEFFLASKCGCPIEPPADAMALLLGHLPGIEQVELDFSGDSGDAGLAGLAGGEVAGLLGFPRAGPVRAVAGEEAGNEDPGQERGEGEAGLLRGGKPRRCWSRRPGRAGS